MTAADACKAVFIHDTEPETTEHFLQENPHVPPQFELPPNAALCSTQPGEYGSVATGQLVGDSDTPRTSCDFSINVQAAFREAGAQSGTTVVAYSPVMHRMYEMHCEGFYPIACRGGDQAIVYLY